MPIDLKSVQWDDIDPNAVQWDDAKPKARSRLKETGEGILRGAAGIGNTLLTPVRAAANAMGPNAVADYLNRSVQGEHELDASNKDSNFYGGAKLATQIGATLPVGGAVALPIKAASRVFPSLAPLAEAAATSGFKATGLTGAANVATRALGGGLTGGAAAGLINPNEAGTGAAIGAALPPALRGIGLAGKAAGNALSGGALAPEVNALAQRAAALGIKIPADRLVDSKPLNALASGLNYVPFSGRAGTEAAMESQLNRAASKLIGQDTPNMTKAIRDAGSDLGAKFETTLKGNIVKVDDELLNAVGGIEQTASRELGSDSLKAISGQIDEILAKGQTGQIDGQAAYNIKRALDRIGKRNTPEAFHALELKRALMGALDRSLGPQEAAAFKTVREQYGNMLSLEKIAKNGAEGDISVARFANMRNINNGSLQELADIAAQFVKPREGQHGAMQRGFAAMGISGAAGPAGLAAAAAGGRAANMTLNSNALRSMLLTGQSPTMNRLGSNERLNQLAFRAAPTGRDE